jgi:hypothetical protein
MRTALEETTSQTEHAEHAQNINGLNGKWRHKMFLQDLFATNMLKEIISTC